MEKTVTIHIGNEDKKVISCNDSTILTFQIGYNPHHKKLNVDKYHYFFHGVEKGKKGYALDFGEGEIKEKQKIQIQFDSEEEPNIKPKKTLIKNEKRCSFCNKLDSEVEVIVEKNFMQRICNECVDVCRKTIEERNV